MPVIADVIYSDNIQSTSKYIASAGYIAFGILAICVLVCVVFYIWKRIKTHASPQQPWVSKQSYSNSAFFYVLPSLCCFMSKNDSLYIKLKMVKLLLQFDLWANQCYKISLQSLSSILLSLKLIRKAYDSWQS